MRVVAVVNPASGSVPQDAVERLSQWLEGRLFADVCVLDGTRDFAAAIESCLSENTDCLVVWAGDGTTALALSLAAKHAVPVLALPGGTMNLLHERIYGDLPEVEMLVKRTLADPEVLPLSAARVGEHRFYVGALIGQITRLTEAREAVREGELLEAAQEMLGSDVLDTRAMLDLVVGGSADKERQLTAAAAAVFVRDGGELEFGAVDPDSGWDVLKTIYHSINQGWRAVDELNHIAAVTGVCVDSEENQKVPVTLDGERYDLSLPLQIVAVPEAGSIVRSRSG